MPDLAGSEIRRGRSVRWCPAVVRPGEVDGSHTRRILCMFGDSWIPRTGARVGSRGNRGRRPSDRRADGARYRRPVGARGGPRCPTPPGVNVGVRWTSGARPSYYSVPGANVAGDRGARVFSIPKFFLSMSSPLVPRHVFSVSHTPVSRLFQGLIFFFPSCPAQVHASPVPEHRPVRRSRTG